MSRAHHLAVFLGLFLLGMGLPGCGERERLADFLPKGETEDPYEDEWIDGLDDGVKSTTDLNHAVVRGKLESLAEQIEAWREEHGALPKGLEVLTPAGEMEEGRAIIPDGAWRVPTDPWQNPYEYEQLEDGGYVVRSWGPDGVRDTTDDLVESRI